MRSLLICILLLTASPVWAERVLVCIGDSETYGRGVEQAYTFCGLNNGINKGIGGDSSQGGLVRFYRDVVLLNPTHVVVGFGKNDCYQDSPGVPRVSTEEFTSNMSSMVYQALRVGIKVILRTSSPNARTELNVSMRPCVDATREVARAWNVPVLDSYSIHAQEFIQGIGWPYILWDGVHPTYWAHRIEAQKLAELLR